MSFIGHDTINQINNLSYFLIFHNSFFGKIKFVLRFSNNSKTFTAVNVLKKQVHWVKSGNNF